MTKGEEWKPIIIDDSAIDKVAELGKVYEETWGKKVDYKIMPPNITQEQLVEILSLMIKTNDSLLVAWNKLYNTKDSNNGNRNK